MTIWLRLVLAVVCGWLALYTAAAASDQAPPRSVCEPGWIVIEETCYREVVRYCCKLVHDTKKVRKTVYECREEPFCLPLCSCPFGGHKPGCAGAACEPPRVRRILIKKEIVEEQPTVKCVVETVVEHVPYTVCRKVPCATEPLGARKPN